MNRPALLAELRRDYLERHHRCDLLFILHVSCAAAALNLTEDEAKWCFAEGEDQ